MHRAIWVRTSRNRRSWSINAAKQAISVAAKGAIVSPSPFSVKVARKRLHEARLWIGFGSTKARLDLPFAADYFEAVTAATSGPVPVHRNKQRLRAVIVSAQTI